MISNTTKRAILRCVHLIFEHSDTWLHLWSAFGSSTVCRRCSVCLCSCNHPFGILDVCRRILRHHWRCGMARFILSVWSWGGYPESGRTIHRAEDLVGDSCATFKVIGPIQAVQPTRESFRSG